MTERNRLRNSLCYLIGPIDDDPEQGRGFRKTIREECDSLMINWLDPTDKVKGLTCEVNEDFERMSSLRASGNFQPLQRMMKSIVRADLRCVDYSDFTIAFVDPDTHMCGSYHEIVKSLEQHKPTLIVVKGGLKKCPSWLFGIAKLDEMFNSVADLRAFLHDIDRGKLPPNDRWVLIRDQIKSITKEDTSHV